jgi:cation:H+ antiporter
VLILVLLGAGLALLLIGGELLVRSASRLALRLGLTPLVVGLTVVAVGTSSPELAVSVAAALRGEPDIALGNVIGSNIANILLVLGLAAAVRPLAVSRHLLRLDVPVMIAASAAVVLLGLDGRIDRLEGILLLVALGVYVLTLVRGARRVAVARPRADRQRNGVALRVGQTLAGLGALVLGAHWMVRGAITLARSLGVGELVIGLTIVAVGTSLPEIVSSAVASARGERDIAAGNVIGSNTFNLLLVLGSAAALAPAGVPVAPGVLRFDLPLMVAVAVLAVPVLFTGRLVSRWEGVLFLGLYATYVTYLVLDARQHSLLPVSGATVALLVLPLVAALLAALALRQWRRGRR